MHLDCLVREPRRPETISVLFALFTNFEHDKKRETDFSVMIRFFLWYFFYLAHQKFVRGFSCEERRKRKKFLLKFYMFCLLSHLQILKPSNHATIQSLVHAIGIPADVPAPCCVPDSLTSVTLLFFDENRNVVLKNYPAMSVESCACR